MLTPRNAGRGDGAHRFDEFAARAGRRRGRAAFIETAAVFELQVSVEAEEVGGADRAIGAGNVLAFIVKIGKREIVALGEFGPVYRIRDDPTKAEAILLEWAS